jgi:uncharacterized membrane protein YwzB
MYIWQNTHLVFVCKGNASWKLHIIKYAEYVLNHYLSETCIVIIIIIIIISSSSSSSSSSIIRHFDYYTCKTHILT